MAQGFLQATKCLVKSTWKAARRKEMYATKKFNQAQGDANVRMAEQRQGRSTPMQTLHGALR